MLDDLSSLKKIADEISFEAIKSSKKEVRKAASSIDVNLVMSTPVDTGRARANWVVTTGTSFSGEITKFSKNAASAQKTINEGIQVIKSWDGESIIYISNNLVYIDVLNSGSSAQAPKGFVEEAIKIGLA